MSPLSHSIHTDAKRLITNQAAPIVSCFVAAAVARVLALRFVLADDEGPVDSLEVGRLVGVTEDVAPDDGISVVRDVGTRLIIVDEEGAASDAVELSGEGTVVSLVETETSDEATVVSDDDEGVSYEEVSSEVTCEVVDVAVLSVVETAVGVVCVSACVIDAIVVSGTRPPVMGATAYGGSKSPKFPHALHGEAQDFTGAGAARMGSHRPLGAAVAITDASSV